MNDLRAFGTQNDGEILEGMALLRQSRIVGYEVQSHTIFLAGTVFHTMQRRCGSWYGRGRNNTASITLKIAVLAPIANARTSTAVMVNPGLRRRTRIA